MAYEIKQCPGTVYPGEIDDECPEARAEIDLFLQEMISEGPFPVGRQTKPLPRKMGGLYQANLKVEKRQIRILYSVYGKEIVLFRIHKKSSSGEQQRAYKLAIERKRKYEANN